MAADYLTLVKDPRLAEALTGVQQRASRFVSVAGPKLSQVAQDTAKSVTEHGLAAGHEIAQALRKEGPVAVAAIRKAAKGSRKPGFSILRFAAQRPVTLILGGVAVAGLGIALGRWLTARDNALSETAKKAEEIGEDVYEDARDYGDRAKQFLEEQGDDISDLAHEAGQNLGTVMQKTRSRAKL